MNRKNLILAAIFVVGFVLFANVESQVKAADEWFVLGEKTIKSVDPSMEIKSEGGRWAKDVKQTKISVEGADVEITKVVLRWDNRPDVTITDIGSPEGRRTDGSEGCSGTQGTPHVGGGHSTKLLEMHNLQ